VAEFGCEDDCRYGGLFFQPKLVDLLKTMARQTSECGMTVEPMEAKGQKTDSFMVRVRS